MQLSLKKTDRDVSQYVLRSEHEAMLKKREEDLVADMRKQLSIGYSDMCKKTSEAVEVVRAEHRKDITRLEEDRQHFVNELAASMNEVTRLRVKHHEYGEGEYDVDQGEEYYEPDELDHWYHDETGYPDAAGVGPIDYGERVRRASAPLQGPHTTSDCPTGPTDFISAARKAAQAAATAANEHSQNNKAYENLSVPSFPKSGEMTNWIYSLGTATVVSGCFGDKLEVKWLRECWSKSFNDLECSDFDGTVDQTRWR
jgi:hypothetical protein